MAAGDVFKLVLISQNGSTTINNIFHYRQTFGVTGGDILAQEFINEVFPAIRDILHTSTVFKAVEYLNYNDVADFGVDNSIDSITGVRGGEGLPRFNAWAFKYNRETRATRNGAKRFSVVSESDQGNGAPTADALAVLNPAADALGQFVNFGGTEIWQPVIARLSADGSEVLLTNDVKNVTFSRLSSQNSRKPF